MAVKLLRGFAYGWMGLVALSILLGIAGAFMTQPFWDAVSTVQGWFSPFNLVNYFVVFVVSLPGIGAYTLAERLEARRPPRSPSRIAEATQKVEALINAYGKILEENPGLYVDEAKLPAPKETMKQALILAARAQQAAGGLSDQAREVLRTGCMNLAYFVSKEEADKHLRFQAAVSDAQGSDDLQAAARAILDAAGDDREREAREARCSAEARRLLADFDDAIR